MDVTPLVKEGQQIIQNYAGGSFRVSGVIYEGPIIVTPAATTNWTYIKLNGGVSDLEEGDFVDLVEQAETIDVVLLGCGAKMAFLEPALKNALKEQGLPVETMDTGAACRTYNVLMAEGRRVAAALLPA